MIRILFLPPFHFWYMGVLWGVTSAVPAFYLARRKNRSAGGWVTLCALTGLFLGVLSFAWVVLLATRKKLSMRMKYLRLKMEERLAEALRLPSQVGQDMEKRILMVLAYNPQGLRINALAQGLGLGWRHILSVVEKLTAQGKIRKEQDRYFFNLD